jgi:hypothetical protein
MEIKPTGDKTGYGVAMGITIGAGMGIIFALALGWNIALGVLFGAGIGLVVGSTFESYRSVRSK